MNHSWSKYEDSSISRTPLEHYAIIKLKYRLVGPIMEANKEASIEERMKVMRFFVLALMLNNP